MIALIGLGNPHKKFHFNRHNVGRLFLDFLKKEWQLGDFKMEKKIKAKTSRGFLNQTEILLVKPEVFMNQSGQCVSTLKKYYRLKNNDLIIIHDESDLYFSKFKISQNKNAAGHHGVESIFNALKTKNIVRVRIGIRPTLPHRLKAGDFVLTDFNAKEQRLLKDIFKKISEPLKEEITKIEKERYAASSS